MNESIVKILEAIKQKFNDKNFVHKALIKLRTDFVKDKEDIIEFHKCEGSIPLMIKLLNRPHEKILEVTLSILGNCCTNQNCCIEALENKIVLPLITILKNVTNPLIQNRACRLLGNLARENKCQLLTYSIPMAQSLCLILEESDDIVTRMMATRATKFLLTDKEFLKTFITHDGFKIITQILIKMMLITQENPTEEISNDDNENPLIGLKKNQHREKYFEEVARNLEGTRSDIFDRELLKKDRKRKYQFEMPADKAKMDLSSEILKCILIISEFQTHGTAAALYYNELGLANIVYFTSKDNKYRSLALNILSNYSKNLFAEQVMNSSDAVVSACELLTDTEVLLTDSEKRYCINIICSLSGNSCNRAKIRCSGVLRQLIHIARNSKSFNEISLILFTFQNFQYDSISMELMVREGLIGILIQELNKYLDSGENSDDQRKKYFDEKRLSRKRKSELKIDLFCKMPKVWDDQDSPSGSPKHYASPSSPGSSRGFSPVGNYSANTLHDDENSDYSPVCSENEDDSSDEVCDKQIKTATPDDFDILSNLLLDVKTDTVVDKEDISDKEDEDNSCDGSKKTIAALPGRNAIDVIDSLLVKITLSVCKYGELGKPETLNCLINAIKVFGSHNGLSTSLTHILSQGKFFSLILKQNVINQLYKMTKVKELKESALQYIDTLTCVAESNYGVGEILKLLKNDDNEESQIQVAIAVAFIIKKPQLLYSLLSENGALYIIINTILKKDNKYRNDAANAITALSNTLHIILPDNEKKLSLIEEFDESLDFESGASEDLNKEQEVIFLLHKGCSQIPIKFNRRILSENSDVFNLMLNSDFREKSEGAIHLSNYTVHGIKYFLNLISLLAKKHNPNIPPSYYLPDSLLEAYELSKMYIINELENKLFNMLIFSLSSKTILKIFEWSISNHNSELSEIAINYYLCSDSTSEEKIGIFREADYSKFSKEWNQMIIDAILVKCQNLCNGII